MVPESKVMTFPWEKQAMNGDELPIGLDYPEQILYMSLRLLYDTLKKGIIDRQTALREKKQLLTEYRQYKFCSDLEKQWVEQIKATELARAEYRKNPTKENGMKLIQLIEGGWSA